MDVLVRATNAFLMLAMPLALGVLLARRLKVNWGLFGAGAAIFIGSQILHIPFNAWLLAPAIEKLGLHADDRGLGLGLVSLLYGLSAGIFEDGARYLAYRFWIKDARTWSKALMFGAGHGGTEAFLLGALALFALLQAFALRGTDLSTVVPADQVALAQQQIQAYWDAPWYAALLGAAERASALCVQVSLAVLVLQAFTRRSLLWLMAAVGWHAAVDALAVYAVVTTNVYLTEGLIALCALASLGLVLALRQPEPATSARDIYLDPPRPSPPHQKSTSLSAEHLEDSRFVR